MKGCLLALMIVSSFPAFARVDFDQLYCTSSKHQIQVERLNSYQLKVSIYRLFWDVLLPPREKVAKVIAFNQVAEYEETQTGVSSNFKSVVGESILGTKIKKTIRLRLKEGQDNNILAEYNNSGEIECIRNNH